MAKRSSALAWMRRFRRNVRQLAQVMTPPGPKSGLLRVARAQRKVPAGTGDWLSGAVVGPAGVRRYNLFRPAGVKFGEQLPLMVMLHGCGQDAQDFAASTRMNLLAARYRFLVLYPEQDRLSNGQRCWNWFDTRYGRAHEPR